jgi:glycosyltransferase involved in cell wall biosynthesis
MTSTDHLVTIVTPSYNRSQRLKNLYNSLLRQTCYSFLWIIIDDGSTDSTKDVVKEFNTNLFEIKFFTQKNSGKHRAINNIVDYVSSELIFIVDSDDMLTFDAIETIYSDFYSVEKKLIGLSYLRSDTQGYIIGDEFTSDRLLSTHADERIINNIEGDKAEVWKTSEFKKIPFLEFDNERFFSEQHKYLAMSGTGEILFRNKSIYICEYLPDGLSSKIRKLQYENPSGALANAVALTIKSYPFKTRFKAFLKVYSYSRISGVRFLTVFRGSDYELRWLLLTPIGSLYHLYLVLDYKFHGLLNRSR